MSFVDKPLLLPGTADQLRITAVQPAVEPGMVRAQVALAHWLVAVVQGPVGLGYADLKKSFPVGAAWPVSPFPRGHVLLGYLDARDLAVG
jgi:hypothetical protein